VTGDFCNKLGQVTSTSPGTPRVVGSCSSCGKPSPYQLAPEFLIFDHDARYGLEVPAAIRSMKIGCVQTSIQSPCTETDVVVLTRASENCMNVLRRKTSWLIAVFFVATGDLIKLIARLFMRHPLFLRYFLYHVHLYHWLESNGYGRWLAHDDL
jgi:hypothetical protein